jgi:hypothetical protein
MFCRPSLPSLRSYLAVSALVAMALCAQADEVCGTPDSNGVSICSAGLQAESVRQLAVVQEQPQWCWAASISMIFAHHGYSVRQEEIVKEGYGGVAANLPAPSGRAMTKALSRRWVDGNARSFQGRAVASDTFARQFQVSEHKVLAELADGHPLLLGALGHAVVLVELKYERSERGNVRILGGTVIDPQPGVGVRALKVGEMKPTYVAAMQMIGDGERVAAAEGVREIAALH